jgi:hypothetical protein
MTLTLMAIGLLYDWVQSADQFRLCRFPVISANSH